MCRMLASGGCTRWRVMTPSLASPIGRRTTAPRWRRRTRSRWAASTRTTTRFTCCPSRASSGGGRAAGRTASRCPGRRFPPACERRRYDPDAQGGDDVLSAFGQLALDAAVEGAKVVSSSHGEFAVAVAAEVDGTTQAGAVVRPAYGDWLAADTEGAAGSNAAAAVSDVRRLDEALIAVGVGLFGDSRMASFRLLERLLPEVRDFRRIGSASCELFGVATGSLDAYVGIGTEPWDLAPGWALVAAAGGRCLQLTTVSGRRAYVLGAPAITDGLAGLVQRYA